MNSLLCGLLVVSWVISAIKVQFFDLIWVSFSPLIYIVELLFLDFNFFIKFM
jgi:hypothetical protein